MRALSLIVISILNSAVNAQGQNGMTKILVANGEYLAGNVEVLDISGFTTICNSLPSFPTEIDSAVEVFGNGKVYICGGKGYYPDRDRHDSACFSFAGKSKNKWDPAGSLSIARAASAGALLSNGSWWITGGQSNYTQELDSTELYDFATETSTPSSMTLPNRRTGHCLVPIEGQEDRFLLAGGFAGQTDYADTWIIDASTGSMQRQGDMALGRSFAYCGYAETSDGSKREIVVGGGLGVDGLPLETESTEIFDLSTLQWRSGPNMPFQMDNGAVVQEDKTLIAIGGKYKTVNPPDAGLLAQLNRFNVGGSESWSFVPQDVMETQRWAHDAVFVPDTFVDCF